MGIAVSVTKSFAKKGLSTVLDKVFPNSALRELQHQLKAAQNEIKSMKEAGAPAETSEDMADLQNDPLEELNQHLEQQLEDIQNELAGESNQHDIEAFQTKFEEGAAERNDWFKQYMKDSGVPEEKIDELQQNYESKAIKSKEEEVESDLKQQQQDDALDKLDETNPNDPEFLDLRSDISDGNVDPDLLAQFNSGELTSTEFNAAYNEMKNPSIATEASDAPAVAPETGMESTASSSVVESGTTAGADVSAEEVAMVLAL